MTLTVYGANVSPFVRKVRVLLMEKGVDYTLEQVNVFDPPAWFLQISPVKRIPVLRDTAFGEDFTVPDSSVICAYLERRHPEPRLYPADDRDFARALFLEEHADSELAPVFGAGIFRARIVDPLTRKQPPDEALVAETVEKKLPRLFDYLEGVIGTREFLVGEALTIADIAVASMFANIYHAEVRVDPARWPRLAAYVDRMHARPSFRSCIEEEAKVFSFAAVKARLART